MKLPVLCALLFPILLLTPYSVAQQAGDPFPRIVYTVSMPFPSSHLFNVSIAVEIPNSYTAPSVDFQMPRWQPGRYAVADFAKNVQEFSASSGRERLPAEKIDDQTWRVHTGSSRSLTVSYKVFGNDLSGTYAQLDSTHANFNGGELFMYVVGRKHDPVELRVSAPPGWRAINGNSVATGQMAWMYPNYELLIDTPTEIGPDWSLDEFAISGRNYRVVVHSRGDEGGLRPRLVNALERIVRANIAMWGQPDFDRYTFLIHYAADDRSGDGMEHLTSTQIILSGELVDPGSLESTLETASHEFFHVWNVKRLRPAELGPWDWTQPVRTKSLWIAEGVTEYYGYMMLRRAGIWEDARFIQELGRLISNVENAPGRRLMSPVDASLAAPFIDTYVHRQRTNLSDTSLTYYYSGAAVAFILDLMIRQETNGARSLDDVFKQMYEEFYLKGVKETYYLAGRGYREEDFIRILERVAGMDMTAFYDKHIRGVEPLPYDAVLARFGLRLVKSPSVRDYANGIRLDNSDRSSVRLDVPVPNSPAARAGFQQGDVVVRIGGIPVDRGNWSGALRDFRPGQRVPIEIERFRRTLTLTLEIGQPDTFTYRLMEVPNASSEARALRSGWLSNSNN